jgi:hypothetical protein
LVAFSVVLVFLLNDSGRRRASQQSLLHNGAWASAAVVGAVDFLDAREFDGFTRRLRFIGTWGTRGVLGGVVVVASSGVKWVPSRPAAVIQRATYVEIPWTAVLCADVRMGQVGERLKLRRGRLALTLRSMRELTFGVMDTRGLSEELARIGIASRQI